MTCVFCDLADEVKIAQSEHFYAVWDIDPIQSGHLLIIAKAHRMAIAELSQAEGLDLLAFQQKVIGLMENQEGVKGVTLALNNGALMDEGTHFHCHLIPRFEGDEFWETLAPRQGVFDNETFLDQLKQS